MAGGLVPGTQHSAAEGSSVFLEYMQLLGVGPLLACSKRARCLRGLSDMCM